MNFLNTAQHVGIFGKSGMGKTSLALRFARASHHARVAAFDWDGQFALRTGCPLARNMHEFLTLFQTHRCVAYDFAQDWGGEVENAFENFAGEVLDQAENVLEPRGLHTLFYCDEIQKFTGAHVIPPAFKDLLELGRRYNVSTVSLSPRPNAMNAAMREQFTELFLFRLSDKRTHEFVEHYGLDPDEIAALPPHHYLYLNVIDGRTSRGELKFAKGSS